MLSAARIEKSFSTCDALEVVLLGDERSNFSLWKISNAVSKSPVP